MKGLKLLGTVCVALSTMVGLPAVAAVNADAVVVEEATTTSLDVADIAQEKLLLASYEHTILLVNNSSVDVVYDLDGVSYQLPAGMWRAHSFSYYGDGDRYIDFDFSAGYGWQNQTYNLNLDSSYVFEDLGYGLVDLFFSP